MGAFELYSKLDESDVKIVMLKMTISKNLHLGMFFSDFDQAFYIVAGEHIDSIEEIQA